MEIVAQPQEEFTRKSRRKISFRGMFSKRRKMLILSGMFVLLIVTGYLNWALNTDSPTQGQQGGGQAQHSIVVMRNARVSERTTQLAILHNMATSEAYSDAVRENAANQRLAVLEAIAFETAAEGLLKSTLGFQDAIVLRNGENINVVIRHTQQLTPTQMTQVRLALSEVLGKPITGDLLDNLVVNVVQ